jgi:hypothetical protein
MCLVMFVLAELFVMVVGSKVSLIDRVLCGLVSHTDYSEEELPANNIEIPIVLAGQRLDITTNAPSELEPMESIEKEAYESLSIDPEIDETDDEVQPVG